MYYESTPEGKDPQLWQLAQRRASFKRHAATYFIINVFLWTIWFFTGGRNHSGGLPWPAWASLGWGIGLASHYAGAYFTNGPTSVDREYEKLKQNNSK